MMAVGLMMTVMHQPMPVIEAMPLKKLFVFAGLAAAMSGRKFE